MPEEVPANVPVALGKNAFPRRFGRYVLEKNLSRGGMGEVFLALPFGVQKHCVIKTIRGDLTGDKEFVGRFADEAKIMTRIKHDNIIRVFDCGRVGGDYYIAMEFLYGRDLGDVLDRAYEKGEPMPKDIGVYLTLQLLRGLDYAHSLTDEHGRPMRLVHRDISPQNVLVGFDGAVKLIDFGLARTELLPGRTQGALAVGKYGYMSPEQARHEKIDGRADIYSFGVMLFEVFTGDRLVDEQDQATLWQRVLSPKHRPPSAVLPDIGIDIDELVMTAVAVRAEERFQSAQEMSRFIQQRMKTKPCSRERLIKYLRYLYPNTDFSAPPIPTFDNIAEPSEKSMTFAMSEDAARSVFGRGELPVEWTMQYDAEALRAMRTTRPPAEKAASDRRDGASALVRDEYQGHEEASTGEVVMSARDRAELLKEPPAFHVVDDAPTTIARPADVLGDEEATRFERTKSPDRRPDSPVTAGHALNPERRSSSHGFSDDEATVMMNMPPPGSREWKTEDENVRTEFIEPTKISDKTGGANGRRTSAPPPAGGHTPKRAIQEKKNPVRPDPRAEGRGTSRGPGRSDPGRAENLQISEPRSGPNLMLIGLFMMGVTIVVLLLMLIRLG